MTISAELTLRSPRQNCSHCQRPLSSCICTCIQTLASDTELLILQHPQEVYQAKGSAGLLHLCLSNSALLQGECFDPQQLEQALFPKAGPQRLPVLLYPDELHNQAPDLCQVRPPAYRHQPGAALRLVLLDATWRKSRKMLYRNPILQTLPRLSLDGAIISAYQIRKAEREGQLSTMEAAAYALIQLEPGNLAGQALLKAFGAFVDLQMGLQRRHQGQSEVTPCGR